MANFWLMPTRALLDRNAALLDQLALLSQPHSLWVPEIVSPYATCEYS